MPMALATPSCNIAGMNGAGAAAGAINPLKAHNKDRIT